MSRLCDVERYEAAVRTADVYERIGKVTQVVGLAVECVGLSARMNDVCRIVTGGGENILADVVGLRTTRCS